YRLLVRLEETREAAGRALLAGRKRDGILTPRFAIQLASAGLWRSSAPLFPEEGASRANTVVAQSSRPFRRTGSCAAAALATANNPFNPCQIKFVQCAEQGFSRDETHSRCVDGAQSISTTSDSHILDRRTNPNIR